MKDVLDAIARLEKGQAEIRREMATKAEMNERFDRVDKELASLDADLDRHMKIHKEIDKRLDALKPRPAKVTARHAGRARPAVTR